AGGTVTFSVYTDNQCSTLATTGNAGQIDAQPGAATATNNGSGTLTANSATVTFHAAGTYYWQTVFNRDSNNHTNPSTSPCQSEILTVASPSISVLNTTDTGTVNAGATIHYTLTVSNNGSGTATTFHITDTLPSNPGLAWTISGTPSLGAA